MKTAIFVLGFMLGMASMSFAEVNEKYSYKDFTGQNFLDIDPSEFSNTTIVGSCFYQSKMGSKVFPDGIENVTFERNNLDNVLLPDVPSNINLNVTDSYVSPVNTYIDNTHKYIRVIGDETWVLSRDGKETPLYCTTCEV